MALFNSNVVPGDAPKKDTLTDVSPGFIFTPLFTTSLLFALIIRVLFPVNVIVFIKEFLFTVGALAEAGILTLSVFPGVPFGDQLVLVPQSVSVAPVHT